MIQTGDRCSRQCVIASNLDAQGSLTSRRQQKVFRQVLGDPVFEAKPVDACSSQDNAIQIVFIQFFQAGVQVPAKRNDIQIRSVMEKLGGPAKTAGADAGTGFQVFEAEPLAGDQNIKRIFPLRNRAYTEAWRYIPRHILHAVNGDINATVQKRFFDFLNKQPLAADLGQGHIQNFISLGFDDLNLNGQMRMLCFNGLFDPVCLPEGQHAAAGSYA